MTLLGDRLKELRDKAGLTQTDLAAKSGLSLGVIHDYEQGKREPTLRSAVKLAAALGVSVEVLAECVKGEPPERPRRGKAKTSKAGAAEEDSVGRSGRPKKGPPTGEARAKGPRKGKPS
jgi:transcriptional regulator with XRE-family HTH domain